MKDAIISYITMEKSKIERLTSNGPIFPKGYEPTGWKLNGKALSPLCEEMLWKAARFIDSDYEIDAFKPASNMWVCLQPQMPAGMTAQFSTVKSLLIQMKAAQEQAKLDKKALTKDEKLADKAAKDALKEEFGYAMLNGEKVRLAMCAVEDSGWILTRGKDPRKFCWKYAVDPSEVTLNIVNEKPPKGWKGKVESKPNAMWVMKYKVKCGLPTMACFKELGKTINFHVEVDLRQDAIDGKFDTCKDILANWNHIQSTVLEGARKGRHDAIIVYLVTETGIRIGSDRDETKVAATYGMSTLLKEHMVLSGNEVTFDFLGKDSVPDQRTISIDAQVWTHLKKIWDATKKGERIFGMGAGDVNKFLKGIMPGITVKNLRTVKCNEILVANLKKQTVTAANTQAEKLRAMFLANLEIATQLNHQKGIGKTQKEGEEKIAERVAKAKQRVKDLKAKHKDRIAKLDAMAKKNPAKKASIKEQKEKMTAQMERAVLAIEKTEFALDKKKMTAQISLGTSLANYAAPQVIVSWCKEMELDPSQIYSKGQLAIIAFALGTPAKYWRNYPS